jgi:hypothetical protein
MNRTRCPHTKNARDLCNRAARLAPWIQHHPAISHTASAYAADPPLNRLPGISYTNARTITRKAVILGAAIAAAQTTTHRHPTRRQTHNYAWHRDNHQPTAIRQPRSRPNTHTTFARHAFLHAATIAVPVIYRGHPTPAPETIAKATRALQHAIAHGYLTYLNRTARRRK